MNNPFRKIKEKKEAQKKAQEEAERARKEAEKLEDKKKLIITCVFLLACFIFIGSMAFNENDSVNEPAKPTTIEKKSTSEDTLASAESDDPAEPTFDEFSILADTQETTNVESEKEQFNPVTNYSANFKTDYSHIESDIVCLGNDEELTIILNASPAGLNKEDFLFYYDESMLSVSIVEEISDTTKNQTSITLKAHAIETGVSDFIICSSYDLDKFGEQAKAIAFSIKGLDAEEGRVVYVTSNGEKYHSSKACTGDNWIATTMRDVKAYEYKPCGKCVQ